MMHIKLEVISREPASNGSNGRHAPLLFVHGAWHGAWCWEEHFLPYFAEQGYSAYAISLRGHGNSTGHDMLLWWSFQNYVEDLRSVITDMEAHPILIGHSMGGYAVQKYLEEYDAPAAVLMAPIPTSGTLPFSLRLFKRHPLAMLRAALTLNPYYVLGKPGLARDAMFSPDMPEEKVQGYAAMLQSESFRVLLDTTFLNLPKPKKIKTPIMVVGAENDTIFHPDEIHRTAHDYNTQAYIFPDMAHDMMLEAGWQNVADCILGWLDARSL